MSQLVKLVSVTLFGSAALMMAALQIRESRARPQPVAAMAAAPGKGQPAPPAAGGNMAMLYADSRGHFAADIYVRGVPVRTLVDTGASLLSLSHEDAAKIGLRAEPGQRKAQFQTANGIVTASITRIPEVRLQGITVHDVEAAIMPPGAMHGTLLGMSFMKKLAGYESRGTSMVLRK